MWRMCLAYWEVRHERETRQAYLGVVVSLLGGRSGPYETSGINRGGVLVLDALLVLPMKGARTLKRFVLWIAKVAGVKRGGKSLPS